MLLDPTQPVSGSNPVQVDSGMPSQDPCSASGVDCSNSNGDTNQATGYSTGSISGSQVSGIHEVIAVYIKGGKLFMVNLASGASHTPVQVSNLSNLCGLDSSSGQQLSDYSNVGNSWVVVGQAGPDNICYNSDDVQTIVQLSTPSTSAPPAQAGFQGAIAQHSATGAISGFFDGEISGGNLNIVHRNASFGSPTTVTTVAAGGQVGVFQAGLQTIYFAGALTSASPQLFLGTASGLSAPLYTFVNGDPHQAFKHAASDASSLYFADGNLIMSIPRSGTTVAKLSTLSSGLTLSGNISLTSSRLVFQATNPGNAGAGGVYSVPNNGNNTAATPLAQNSAGTSFTSVSLQAVDPAGLVYINVTSGGTGGVSNTAVMTRDDGTSSSSIPGQWLGEVDSTSIGNANAQLQTQPASILFGVPGTGGSFNVSAYNSTTGTVSAVLGSIANAQFVFSFGLQPYFEITAAVQYSGGTKNDAYIANAGSANSLAPVSTNSATTGNNQGNNSYIGE